MRRSCSGDHFAPEVDDELPDEMESLLLKLLPDEVEEFDPLLPP